MAPAETCPVTALHQWLQAAERNVESSFGGDIFRRFHRGESIRESAMTAQYVEEVGNFRDNPAEDFAL